MQFVASVANVVSWLFLLGHFSFLFESSILDHIYFAHQLPTPQIATLCWQQLSVIQLFMQFVASVANVVGYSDWIIFSRHQILDHIYLFCPRAAINCQRHKYRHFVGSN
jgi:hypothetical protein